MTMETCQEKFEHRGNPWLTERERKELQASLLPSVGGRRYAKPKMPYTDPPIEKRLPDADELARRASRRNVERIAQLGGCKPRQLKPLGPRARTLHVPGPARVELGLERDEILEEAERQERQWKAWIAQEKSNKNSK